MSVYFTDRERVNLCWRDHREDWRVVDRHCNYSAFNGYHRTPSDYSKLLCLFCWRVWRTKGQYADVLPELSEAEYDEWRSSRT